MEAPSIVSNYVYEKDGAGLKGGYPLTCAGAAPTIGGGAAPFPTVGGAAPFPTVGGAAPFPTVGGAAPFPTVGGAAPFPTVGGAIRHLAIPVGIVVIHEYSNPITQYDEPVSDGCVDNDLFEKMLKRVGHREHTSNNVTKKNPDDLSNAESKSKKSTKKHRKAQ